MEDEGGLISGNDNVFFRLHVKSRFVSRAIMVSMHMYDVIRWILYGPTDGTRTDCS